MSTVTRSVKSLLESKLGRVAASNSATSKAMATSIKQALAIHNALGGVREPIARRAVDEQRNDAWLNAETRKAFGARLREFARLQMEVAATARAHAASKPHLPGFDKTDMLASLETIAIAQRIAAMNSADYHKLTSAERMAGLRVPTLAKIPESVANHWSEQAISALDPERMATYRHDLEIIEEAEQALQMVKRSMQQEAGFVDNSTGTVSQTWGPFEREHLAPIRKELEAAESAKAKSRADDAVVAAQKALREAENEQHRVDMNLLKRA